MLADLTHAVRELTRQPRFTSAAVAIMALAVGTASAVFAVVHAVVLAPSPFPGPDRLLARAARHLLAGVGPVDLPTLAAVCCTMAASAALACAIPGCRALRFDPIAALRESH